jgi:16S rRNA C967 or C1407 C5-methylase (RsmB/RsmF family)
MQRRRSLSGTLADRMAALRPAPLAAGATCPHPGAVARSRRSLRDGATAPPEIRRPPARHPRSEELARLEATLFLAREPLSVRRLAKLARLAGRADAVLVDAPCSGTGTLRRNPDMKWRFDPVSLPALGATQRSILKAAAALVKPGGTLVYATCSLLPEENDAVRADFERDHPDWRQQPAGALLAAQGIALADPGAQALALRPDRDGSDGFYAVRWQRPA